MFNLFQGTGFCAPRAEWQVGKAEGLPTLAMAFETEQMHKAEHVPSWIMHWQGLSVAHPRGWVSQTFVLFAFTSEITDHLTMRIESDESMIRVSIILEKRYLKETVLGCPLKVCRMLMPSHSLKTQRCAKVLVMLVNVNSLPHPEEAQYSRFLIFSTWFSILYMSSETLRQVGSSANKKATFAYTCFAWANGNFQILNYVSIYM